MPEFSDFVVYVDESGDHGLARMDPAYPMFVLAFCLVSKADYSQRICMDLQRLKLRFWGHDEQVLHEHEIRKPNKHYEFLFNATKRVEFVRALNAMIREAPFQLVAAVIRKLEFAKHYALPVNPYGLAMEFGLERIYKCEGPPVTQEPSADRKFPVRLEREYWGAVDNCQGLDTRSG